MKCQELENVPQVFRVLIIDDQLCSDSECVKRLGFPADNVQKAITCYIERIVWKEVGVSDFPVDVVYAKDPDEGVALWLDQTFDLTLVDSDFSKSNTSPRTDSEKRSFLDLNLQYTGAYLFRFLRTMACNNANKPGRMGCKIAFWTGLGSHDTTRASELLSILAQDANSEPIIFIPKKEDECGKWNEIVNVFVSQGGQKEKTKANINVTTIEACIGDMKNYNPVLNPQVLSGVEERLMEIKERVKRLYPVAKPADFMEWCGLGGYVFTGCLYQDGRQVWLSDKWIEKEDGAPILLSPLLRQRGSSSIDADDEKILCSLTLGNKDGFPTLDAGPVGWKNVAEPKKHIVAAATPVTGCSAVGKEHAKEVLKKKILALLKGPFGKVVLKTVYSDYIDYQEVEWPEIQVQDIQIQGRKGCVHGEVKDHSTRCLRSTKYPRTLWNSGKTALESFTPIMLNEFLKDLPKECRDRVIVSLGSKYPQANDRSGVFPVDNLRKIWAKLFDDVFKDIPQPDYPIVEINVRHYLRECIASCLSGNEYLSPSKITESLHGKSYEAVDAEFKVWLSVLDDVARSKKKKLLLKLPFRGDIFHFINIICNHAKEQNLKAGNAAEIMSSIGGLTLINAYKSMAGETEGGIKYSPAWYGCPSAWDGDTERKYQMSGELLAAARNEIFEEIKALANRNPGLEIHISGGIVDKNGIEFCLGKAQANNIFVQIGTWALMNLDLRKSRLDSLPSIPPSSGNGKPNVHDCKGCSPCRVRCPNGAFISRAGRMQIDTVKCVNCKECIGQCTKVQNPCKEASDSTNRKSRSRIAFYIHELCNGCGRCSKTFYCDAFLDRRGKELPPLMEPRNCTGCGLCVQTCPRGAIQLFEPKDFVLLKGDGKYDEALSDAHKFLLSEEIPHIVFPADESDEELHSTILAAAIDEGKVYTVDDVQKISNEKRDKGSSSAQALEALREAVNERLECLNGRNR